jgi:hypothetical protein
LTEGFESYEVNNVAQQVLVLRATFDTKSIEEPAIFATHTRTDMPTEQ